MICTESAVATYANAITTHDPGTMAIATEYFWRVIEVDGQNKIGGPVWSFTTVGAPPHTPTPADDADEFDPDSNLNWISGAGGPYTFNVLLDTVTPPVNQIETGIAVTTADPGTLAFETPYYWQVIAIDGSNNEYPSDIWSYTTIVPQCPNPPAADADGDCDVDLGDFSIMHFEWLDCNLVPAATCN